MSERFYFMAEFCKSVNMNDGWYGNLSKELCACGENPSYSDYDHIVTEVEKMFRNPKAGCSVKFSLFDYGECGNSHSYDLDMIKSSRTYVDGKKGFEIEHRFTNDYTGEPAKETITIKDIKRIMTHALMEYRSKVWDIKAEEKEKEERNDVEAV